MRAPRVYLSEIEALWRKADAKERKRLLLPVYAFLTWFRKGEKSPLVKGIDESETYWAKIVAVGREAYNIQAEPPGNVCKTVSIDIEPESILESSPCPPGLTCLEHDAHPAFLSLSQVHALLFEGRKDLPFTAGKVRATFDTITEALWVASARWRATSSSWIPRSRT